ncbi:MAG: NifB/NifX family molybdenum-iron cluster-binding protein [Actinomycetota bacterium]|nr:NifB/NifX family molybdenum-iron cluster-binding protein [Actinomycetota bacterium]MDI6821750.1 NifB/NifX family molybdenum-iron cluster-binding protein [Actinomycetota bacterium]
MKIAVTSTGPDLSSQMDPRFGRCQFFIIVDPETMEFEVIQNPNIAAAGGAGIQSAQLMASKGVKAVLTGQCGPNAFSTLQAAGIQVFTGVGGVVKDAVEQFKSGELKLVSQPTVGPKFGMRGVGSPYVPPGAGLGPGRGMGRGGGMGRGMGAGMGGAPGAVFQPPSVSTKQELEALKKQFEILKEQLDRINQRISDLEKKKKG